MLGGLPSPQLLPVFFPFPSSAAPAIMLSVKILRTAFVLMLALSCAAPIDPLPPVLHEIAEESDKKRQEQALIDLLLKQGKNPTLCLDWPGIQVSPGHLFHVWDLVPNTSNGPRCYVLILGQNSWDIPGYWLLRHVLIDADCVIRDVATVVHSTRLMDRVKIEYPDHDVWARILDLESQREWGNFAPVCIELGVGPDRRKTETLPWTGAPLLGSLRIDGLRFEVRR
jgi:hypothetical protein